MSARNWCFTLNNYTEDDRDKFLDNLDYSYICWGYEIGEEGTPHMQGYVEFKNPKRFTTLKKFNERVHWEIRKGTQLQAVKYTKKSYSEFLNNWEEFGTLKNQGHRSDLDLARRIADEEGMRVLTRIGKYQQIKVGEAYLNYNERERDEKPKVNWYFGPPGSGKTKAAYEDAKSISDDIYSKSEANKWWQGYDAHEIVIMDDFRPDWMPFNELLTLLDRYPRRVEHKGGSRQFLAKHIFITTPYDPCRTFQFQNENLRQLLRRIDVIREFPEDVTEVGGNTRTPTSDPFY